MGDLDMAKAEQRRQRLLKDKADCEKRMRDKGGGPAVHNGDRPSVLSPRCPVELRAENVRKQGLNEAQQKARQIYYRAMSCGDLTNANRALREIVRIEQLELEGHGDLEEQSARMDALPPGGMPLPGKPGGPPLTDEGKKHLEEIKKLSPAARMLMREGYTAMTHISELEAQAKKEGNMSDLLREQPKGEESSMTGPVTTKDEPRR